MNYANTQAIPQAISEYEAKFNSIKLCSSYKEYVHELLTELRSLPYGAENRFEELDVILSKHYRFSEVMQGKHHVGNYRSLPISYFSK